MRKQYAFFWVLMLVAILATIFCFYHNRKSERASSMETGTNAGPLSKSPGGEVIGTNSIAVNGIPGPEQSHGTGPANPPPRDRVAILTAVLNANDADIFFYGRLQDQFSNAVVGATISFAVQYENAADRGVRRGQVTSDENGFFTISGYRGANLTLTPTAPGYVVATKETTFRYSQISPGFFVPDAKNPTIVRMWKRQGAERLIHFQAQVHAPLDGTPVSYDLQTGQRVQSGGDIVIRVLSSPAPSFRDKYDWQVKVDAVNGGLIHSEDDFNEMFQAPDVGYQPEFETNYWKNANTWATTFNETFYLSSRNGNCYGKVAIEILSDIVKDGQVAVILNSYTDPTTSRNLEVDQEMVIDAHP